LIFEGGFIVKNTLSGKLALMTAGLVFSLTATLAHAAGFNSGSTGADGAFSPTANTILPMPPNGIFNFTTVNIPVGVIVRFQKNTANTPVIFLGTGDVTIAGTIDVSGGNSLPGGTGTSGDRSIPGVGGPGGFDGGRGGMPETNRRAGNGLGPGGGGGGDGTPAVQSNIAQGGGGGGYGVTGNGNNIATVPANTGVGGPSYGSNLLTPLVGGSGGGGAGARTGDGFPGTGGAGGGGAILIAASGTVTLTGSILANGGSSGSMTAGDPVYAGTGGGGSGGAVRIAASNIVNSGAINVSGGAPGAESFNSNSRGGAGATGRTNLEIVAAGTLSVTGLPTLAFTSVGGVAAPGAPTGAGDVILPASAPNPATVVFTTTGIPVGNTVRLTLTPQRGAPTTATSTPLTGSLASATSSVAIDIPQGTSTLTASTSYTIAVAMGDSLARFANNERVEKIILSATLGGQSRAALVTVSGKEYDAPVEALRIATVQ
jgi:hypothetical protein